MTRFARAKGSKASNERREEEPTPWHIMRQQFLDQSSSNSNLQNEERLPNNLKNILCSKAPHNDGEYWSDFGELETNKNESSSRSNTKKCKDNEVQNNQSKNKLKSKKKGSISHSVINKVLSDKHTKSSDTSIKKVSDLLINSNVKNKFKSSDKLNKTVSEIKLHDKQEFTDNENNGNITGKQHNQFSEKTQNIVLFKQIEDETVSDESYKESETRIYHSDNIHISIKKRKSEENDNNKTITGRRTSDLKNKSTLNESKCKQKIQQTKQHLSNIPKNKSNLKKCNKNNFPTRDNYNTPFNIIANGREIKVINYEGFLIKKSDASALKKLKKNLISKNIPKDQITEIMKLERRKAEKSLSREKSRVCFHCRQFGHNFSDCPDIKDTDLSKSGMCFKCGSMEHSHYQCKVLKTQDFRHAVCFVCKEQGHIARQCPLNSQGQYPKGGSCHHCGEITHLRKDCPNIDNKKPSNIFTAETLVNSEVEDITLINPNLNRGVLKKEKVIKF